MTLLSTDDFKAAYAGTVPVDDAGLASLLAAEEAAIVARFGNTAAEVAEVHDGGSAYLFLRHRAETAASISAVETVDATDTTLAADDYRLRDDGVSLLRLDTGTNRRTVWGLTTVTYTPLDDSEERKRVQRALVILDLNTAPGISAEQIGAWMEQHQQSSVWNYQTEREAILASLDRAIPPGFA